MLNYRQQATWQPVTGQQQSPINLVAQQVTTVAKALPLKTESTYRLTSVTDDHTTIKVLGNGRLQLFHRQFNFMQLHFHHPAEHLINGEPSPFEIHLVHQNDIGQLAVVALLVPIGKQNLELQYLIDHFHQGQQTPVDFELNNWLPNALAGFHYLGSLTTPPLTEGVEWVVVMTHEVSISQEQLAWFKQTFPANNRQVQAVNQRPIFYYQKH